MPKWKCLMCGEYQDNHDADQREFCDIMNAQWQRDARERMGFVE